MAIIDLLLEVPGISRSLAHAFISQPYIFKLGAELSCGSGKIKLDALAEIAVLEFSRTDRGCMMSVTGHKALYIAVRDTAMLEIHPSLITVYKALSDDKRRGGILKMRFYCITDK